MKAYLFLIACLLLIKNSNAQYERETYDTILVSSGVIVEGVTPIFDLKEGAVSGVGIKIQKLTASKSKLNIGIKQCNGIIDISLPEISTHSSKIKIYNLSGRLIKSVSFFDRSYKLNMRDMASGVYNLRMFLENSVYSYSIIITH